MGRVQLSAHFRVLDIKGERVLGVLVDDFDVESVAVFELEISPIN